MTRRSDAYKERYLERLLSEISPTNQGCVRMFIGRRRAEGLKVASLLNHTFYLNHLDQAAGGEAIETLSPERLNQILEDYTRRQTPETANHFATHLRRFYRSIYDDELPTPLFPSPLAVLARLGHVAPDDAIARGLKRKWRLEWNDKKPVAPSLAPLAPRSVADAYGNHRGGTGCPAGVSERWTASFGGHGAVRSHLAALEFRLSDSTGEAAHLSVCGKASRG